MLLERCVTPQVPVRKTKKFDFSEKLNS